MKIKATVFQGTIGTENQFTYHTFELPQGATHDEIMQEIQNREGDSNEVAESENGYPWYGYEIDKDS